jgi:2-hydroxychromene-2-carboxylate isomerase
VTIPTLYIDMASPYAYLAAARAGSLFRCPFELQPVLLGAIFKLRGWGSWAHTERRAAGIAEIEARAERYGLSPVVWPDEWPANALAADRAAIWAKQQGVGEPFALALYRRQFAAGADISRPEVLAAAAADAGLDPVTLLDAIQRTELKDALRLATDEAWELGVRGVPTATVDGSIFYGDDELEAAAIRAAAAKT